LFVPLVLPVYTSPANQASPFSAFKVWIFFGFEEVPHPTIWAELLSTILYLP
jgi:hypothetical protein